MTQNQSDFNTTLNVKAAIEGDVESTAWIIERFTPLLIAQARYRIGAKLQRIVDPEDLVQDTWAIALPKLSTLPARAGRFTPVVVRFLSTTLLYVFNNQLRKHLGRADSGQKKDGAGSTQPDFMGMLSADITGVVTRAARVEEKGHVHEAIEQLSQNDREIIVLRGIEQNSLEEVAATLDITTKNASVRYGRAILRLREALPDSIIQDLPDE